MNDSNFGSDFGLDAPNADAESAAAQAGDAGQPAKTFTQAEVDRIVRDRLEREKSSREKAALKARAEGETQALKKNQEWQALAEKQAAQSSQAERYKQALEKSLAAEKKDLPRHVLVLLEKLDPVDQIEYLAANREQLGKASVGSGVPASPNPQERTLSDEDKEKARRGQANLYSSF